MKFYNTKIDGSVYLYILAEFSNLAQVNNNHNSWQSTRNKMPMLEVINYYFSHRMPQDKSEAEKLYSPDLPWADDHLFERLCGEPMNPPPSHTQWNTKTDEHLSAVDPLKFSHTYPERYNYGKLVKRGYRFDNGNLDDVVTMLRNDKNTRQAYLPIYLPEDITASNRGERVPCTLGYHFQVVDGVLNISYIIRSCDVIRHLHNDLYLTWGLAKYVGGRIDVKLGTFLFICFNLHCFDNDRYTLNRRLENATG